MTKKATFDPSLDRPWTEGGTHHRAALTFETKDAHGFTPPLKMVGARLLHSGNGKVYVITDFAWGGAKDEWHFLAKEENNPDAVTITRPLLHIQGDRGNGVKRYEILGGSNGQA